MTAGTASSTHQAWQQTRSR